jgi:hypothetical protein
LSQAAREDCLPEPSFSQSSENGCFSFKNKDKNTATSPDSRSKLLSVLQLVKTKKEKLLFNNPSLS